jgi:hypothetical protein
MSKRLRAASLTATPVAYATLETAREEEGGVVFDALFVGIAIDRAPKEAKGAAPPKSCILVPLNIHTLPHPAPAVTVNGQATPVYTRATGDSEAIAIRVKQRRKKGEARVYLPLDDASAIIVANGVPLRVGMYANAGQKEEDAFPPPLSLVKVFNLCGVDRAATADYPNGGCLKNMSALSRTGFNAINALPVTDRVPACLAFARQSLPQVAALADARKFTDKELRARNLTVPVALLSVNRAWAVDTTIGAPLETPAVLPERALPEGDAIDKGLIVGVRSVGSLVRVPDGNMKPEHLRLELTLAVTQKQAPRADAHFALKNFTLWPENFVTLGIVYPRFVDRVLRHNPIPFYALYDTNVEKTVASTQNFEALETRVGCEDGILTGYFLQDSVLWRLAEYLERCCPPVTAQFVRQRYGNRDTCKAVMPADYKTIMANEKMKMVKNPYAEEDALKSHGILAFDEGSKDLPEGDASVRYYALPAFALPLALPRAPRADLGAPGDTAEDLPPAVNLTPADGDSYVLACMPGKPVKLDDWLQPPGEATTVRVPYWFFFAVSDKARLTAAAAVYKPAHAPVTCPATADEASKLPATRLQLATQLLTGHVQLPAPVAASAPPEDDAVEPPAKRARLEQHDADLSVGDIESMQEDDYDGDDEDDA